jgi:START domain
LKIYIIVLLLLLSSELVLAGTGSKENMATQWKKVSERGGITTYKELSPKGDIMGIRGTAMYSHSLPLLLSVMVDPDFSNRKKWIKNIGELYPISNFSPISWILYLKVDMPKPISDRDFVYDAIGEVIMSNRSVVIRYKSIGTLYPKKPDVIRGSFDGVFIVQESPDGRSCSVDIRVLADPKGDLPAWIVNLVQKGYAYDLLSGLKKELERPERKILPAFENIFGD